MKIATDVSSASLPLVEKEMGSVVSQTLGAEAGVGEEIEDGKGDSSREDRRPSDEVSTCSVQTRWEDRVKTTMIGG